MQGLTCVYCDASGTFFQLCNAGNWAGRGYSVWQFTSSGRVPGISCRVDMDRLGKGLAVAGAAVAGYAVGSAIAGGVIDPMLAGEARGKTKADLTTSNVGSIESALRAGRISPEEAEAQRGKIADMVSQARVRSPAPDGELLSAPAGQASPPRAGPRRSGPPACSTASPIRWPCSSLTRLK
jgi:hypothetical protein